MKRILVALLFVALLGWQAVGRLDVAEAATQTSCAGNVCSGSLTVGGQLVNYSWTQNHDDAASSLKVRFWSGPYTDDNNLVRFRITVTRAFSSYSTLKNPSPSTVMPTSQTVNAGSTMIERFESGGMTGNVDFTQELRYGAQAAGTFSMTLSITQYGATASPAAITIYVDPVSPSNRDEGESLTALYGASYKHCADAADNDLDYRLDCADADCLGERIQDSPVQVCEAPETTCNDGLDNSGDGKIDCADPLCNGRPGNLAGTKFCGPENGGTNHANCADGFDNDGNGELDCADDGAGTGCWQTGFQGCAVTEISCTDNVDNDYDKDYEETIDAGPATGVDCRDYDCEGLGNCPTSERLSWDPAPPGSFVDTPAQCFNGLDDDLDGKKDCADEDCLGASSGSQACGSYEAWLPPSPLGTGAATSTPAFYFNYCSDGLDNDGNGLTDANDPDCKNVFGECGPSPATEDYTFLSCSDGDDDDLSGATDCADAACRVGGKLGRAGCLNGTCGFPAKYDTLLTDAAACAASENAANVCGDGLDNDGDGTTDCADAGCVGVRHGPVVLPGYMCGAETGASCSDGADNDSDGNVDCLDSGCQDGIQCAQRPPTGWTTASCLTVPNTTALALIASGGATQFAHNDRIHVNTAYRIRFVGSGAYTSLTIVIGDAVDASKRFPFDASTSNCSLSGTGAAQMTYVSSSAGVGTIFNKAGQTINGFDVTLTCVTTSAVPTVADDFNLSIVANRNGAVEFGLSTPNVRVYEATPPSMLTPAVDVEGLVAGTVDVAAGSGIRLQGLPSNDPSGICKCDFTLEGASASSSDGACLVDTAVLGITFANDNPNFDIAASAWDGASNHGATGTPQVIDVNVVPTVDENLRLGTDVNGAVVHTYRGGDAVNLTAAFRTDTLSTFPVGADACRVFVYDASWAGGQAVAAMTPTAIGNTLGCQGTYTVPAGLAAGRYWIYVDARDSSGDVVRSNVQAFLKCENADVGTGACKDADFDHDGAPEGRFTPNGYASPPTPTYPGEPDPPPGHACDNCVNFYNPNQLDANANGVGDSCEVGAVGRCKYKTCSGSGTACDDDSQCGSGERCINVDFGMCAINCTVDADCQPPGAPLSGTCSMDWGVCDGPAADEGSCCFANADCVSNKCTALVQPFIETLSGQIYAGGEIRAGEESPIYNATYCLQSDGTITNFTSQAGCRLAGAEPLQIPVKEKGYLGSFGLIDVNGILGGKYGALQTAASPPSNLDGKIYYYPTGLTIGSDIVFNNSAGAARANGLVVVKGTLTINGDLSYQDRNESDLKHLASIGWIVLKNDDGSGGNVVIGGDVTSVVGAFFAENSIDTGTSDAQLTATGMFVARNFAFNREYASRTAGSERVTFDARVILNPPPGLTDVTRSLPGFRSVPGQ